MKLGDLVHISIHSPLYSYVGGVGTIVSIIPIKKPYYKIFINGSLCPYHFTKNELELVEET